MGKVELGEEISKTVFWQARQSGGNNVGSTLSATIARSYLVVVLLAAVLAGPTPQAWLALVLLALHSVTLYRPLSPLFDIFLTLLTMILAPLGLTPVIGPFFSTALVLPALVLLDSRLRDLAPFQDIPPFRPGRRSTPILNSLAVTVLAVGLLGLFAASITTLLVAATLLLGLLARLGHIVIATRGAAVTTEPVELRVLAREEGHTRFPLHNTASFPLRIVLSSPFAWLRLPTREITIAARSVEETEVVATPYLAGLAQPTIQTMLLDPWGFIWRGIALSPLQLHVIPRAQYAAWLAQRYLEQTGVGVAAAASGSMNDARGVEFERLRQYQAGDRLSDIDWRSTTKFRELIVKKYLDPQSSGTIILLNLVAGDAQEADWLGYQVVTSALTAASHGVPAALVVYNARQVVLTTALLHPRETLKHSLRISGEISVASHEERLLAPPDLPHLRRAALSLSTDGSENGSGALGELLRREIEALEELAREHPLSLALRQALRVSPPPAAITVISRWNHDTEALAVMLPRLRQQGYRVLDLCATQQ